MSTEHPGLRAWSLARRAKLLKHRKTGASVRANWRRRYLYFQLGHSKWTALYKHHRPRVYGLRGYAA